MLAMRRRLLGNEHFLVASALADVAWAAGFTGKPAEAEALEGEVLVMQRKLLGDQHQDVAKTLSSLGERKRQGGNLTEAHWVLRAALSIQRKLLGATHPDSLVTLRGLAWTLEGEGNWAEAEAAYRESIELQPKPASGEPPLALLESAGLVRALVAREKYDEAEQFLGRVLTTTFVRQPASAELLALRVDLLGRLGRWPEAEADAALVVEHQPKEHYRYHMLAPLLVITHNRRAYEQLCQRILATFKDTANTYVAERMAKDCLLLPDAGVDLRLAGQLADKAVKLERGNDALPYSQVAKGLSEYRQGNFAAAAEWARKPLDHPEIYVSCHARAVLALALWQLGSRGQARAMLAEGEALAGRVVPGRDAGKISGAWVAWLCARISLDEAAGLIKPAPTAEPTPNPR